MKVANYDDGQLRIVYAMTADSANASLAKAMKIVSAVYGDQIAKWMESHFMTTGTVNTGNQVIDGHWVAVGAGRINANTIKVMLIISPNASVPAGVNP